MMIHHIVIVLPKYNFKIKCANSHQYFYINFCKYTYRIANYNFYNIWCNFI